MIIDEILDRKDGAQYNPRDFYAYCMEDQADDITRAMDSGDNLEVIRALSRYIIVNEYNPAIIAYVVANDWI